MGRKVDCKRFGTIHLSGIPLTRICNAQYETCLPYKGMSNKKTITHKIFKYPLALIGIMVILFIKPYPSLADIYDGRVALILGHYEKALKEFEQAAASEDPNALVEIGDMYLLGKGVEVNNILAKDWYLKAAASGADKAYYRLSGLELDKNFEWLKKGSLAEEPASQALLAQNYWLGHYPNGKKDFTKAIYWYQKAAKNGHCVAAESLSSFYEIGSFSSIGDPEKGSK